MTLLTKFEVVNSTDVNKFIECPLPTSLPLPYAAVHHLQPLNMWQVHWLEIVLSCECHVTDLWYVFCSIQQIKAWLSNLSIGRFRRNSTVFTKGNQRH